YTVRRQGDEVGEVDLPTSFWTEQPDLSLRRLGEEVSDDEVSSALEFGIWQYLTSTKGLDVIDVPVRPGGMVLPTGVDALTDFTKPQTFAEFMENDWAFRGLRERFIAGEIDIDFDGVAAILDRVERMDQAEWVGQVDDLIGAGGFARAKFLGLRERVEQTFNEWISLRNSRLGIEALEEGGEVVEWTPAWRRMLGEGAPEGQVVSAKAIQSKRGPDWDNLRESLEQCRRKNS
ncbi:MAG: hypothetical protein OXH01_07840, partial [Bacteroidetes bacterium]|nr:hypothetical protein [Bacteroidota bacterium]